MGGGGEIDLNDQLRWAIEEYQSDLETQKGSAEDPWENNGAGGDQQI
jgi:hypothetical protein